ncbi:MAG: hypothetical protein M1819_005421 [Sarea resinae]|nr:MAG: hypothetical protein M1819_005421 [Sarea resinae]
MNTNFLVSTRVGPKELRSSIETQMEKANGGRVIVVQAQADGLSTNLCSLGIFDPYLNGNLFVFVWNSNKDFDEYKVSSLLQSRDNLENKVVDSRPAARFVRPFAQVALNKESMAQGARNNRALKLGGRNSKTIDPFGEIEEKEPKEQAWTEEAKRERHLKGVRSQARSLERITVSQDITGQFLCPVGGCVDTFGDHKALVNHVVRKITAAE